MAAIIHSSPELGQLRQEGGTGRKPERESFVDEIVNGILADKRPEHGIDRLFTPRVTLKFLECFAIAEGHDHTEIEGLFYAGPIHQQGAANVNVICAARTAECAQGVPDGFLCAKIR